MSASEDIKRIRAAYKGNGWGTSRITVSLYNYGLGEAALVTIHDFDISLNEARALARPLIESSSVFLTVTYSQALEAEMWKLYIEAIRAGYERSGPRTPSPILGGAYEIHREPNGYLGIWARGSHDHLTSIYVGDEDYAPAAKYLAKHIKHAQEKIQ